MLYLPLGSCKSLSVAIVKAPVRKKKKKMKDRAGKVGKSDQ